MTGYAGYGPRSLRRRPLTDPHRTLARGSESDFQWDTQICARSSTETAGSLHVHTLSSERAWENNQKKKKKNSKKNCLIMLKPGFVKIALYKECLS